jgi:transposase
VLGANVWRRVLGVDRATVIEEIDFDEESDTVVVHVRPRRPTKRRCGRCGVRAPGYDQGEGGATGGRSIWARCSASSRPTPRG